MAVVVAVDKLIDALQTIGAEREGDQPVGLEADKAITRTAGPVCRPTSSENAKVRGVDPGNMFLPNFINHDIGGVVGGAVEWHVFRKCVERIMCVSASIKKNSQ
ncbi:C6 zinc finger domain-containing protein [Metarhizium brunneum]